jgi:hypothetical protein
MLMDGGQVDDLENIADLGQVLALRVRVGELENEVAHLREALVRRQRYGVVTGMVAVRFQITPERAWRFLVRLSQQTNLKMQVVARVIHDRAFDRLAPDDEPFAARLDAQLDGQLGRLLPPVGTESADGV